MANLGPQLPNHGGNMKEQKYLQTPTNTKGILGYLLAIIAVFLIISMILMSNPVANDYVKPTIEQINFELILAPFIILIVVIALILHAIRKIGNSFALGKNLQEYEIDMYITNLKSNKTLDNKVRKEFIMKLNEGTIRVKEMKYLRRHL